MIDGLGNSVAVGNRQVCWHRDLELQKVFFRMQGTSVLKWCQQSENVAAPLPHFTNNLGVEMIVVRVGVAQNFKKDFHYTSWNLYFTYRWNDKTLF